MKTQFITLILLSIATCLFAQILPTSLNGFGVLAYSTVTSSGATVVGVPGALQDIGLFPGSSVTGFPPGVINGALEVSTGKAQLAQGDVNIAYAGIANTACTTTLADTELGGKTFAPGVYCSGAPVTLTGTMYLDTKGQVGPVWIFQLAQTLITASSSAVTFVGTPAPCNVFWNIGASATLGSTSDFKGIINAYKSISFDTGATLNGKALAQTGAVTLLGNTLSKCTEQAPQNATCFGKPSTDPNVCGKKKGTCIAPDTCVCGGRTSGTQCEKCQTGYTLVGEGCVKDGSNGAGSIALGVISTILVAVIAM